MLAPRELAISVYHTVAHLSDHLAIMDASSPPRRDVTAEQCAVELRSAGSLVNEQVKAGLDRHETLEALFCTHEKQLIQLVDLSSADVETLTKSINDGPWTKAQTGALARAANGATQSSRKAPKAKRRANQQAPLFENLVPEKMWIDMRNREKFSDASVSFMLARLAAMLGIVNPGQKLLYRMVQIMAYTGHQYDMSQRDVWDKMDKLQDYIKGFTQASGTDYIENYPNDALLLPDAIRERAYPGDDLPVQVDIPELDSILGKSKMRGRPSDGAWLANVPSEYQAELVSSHPELIDSRRRRSTGKQPSLSPPCTPRASGSSGPEQPTWPAGPVTGAAKSWPQAGSASSPLAGQLSSALFASKRTSLSLPAPTTTETICPKFGLLSSQRGNVCMKCGEYSHDSGGDTPVKHAFDDINDDIKDGTNDALKPEHASELAPAGPDGAPPKGSIEEMERELAKASADRIKKKPAAASKLVKKLMKKPASAVITTAKGLPCMKDFWDKQKDTFGKDMKRNVFCCRAYDTAGRRAIAAKVPKATMRVFQRQQHALASDLFDQLMGS